MSRVFNYAEGWGLWCNGSVGTVLENLWFFGCEAALCGG